MGCYNVTCGITQFPIFHGQKTVNLILVENGWDTPVRPCYAVGAWSPFPVPIFGEYNDYGGQEDDPGQEAKYLFMKEVVKNDLIRTPNYDTSGREEYDRYPEITDPFANGDAIDKSTHSKKFSLSNEMGKRYSGKGHRNIAMFMMHRSVYDALTADYVQDYPERRVWTKAELVEGVNKYFEYVEAEKKRLEADDEHGVGLFRLMHGGFTAKDWFGTTYGEKNYGHPMYGILMFYAERYSEGPFCPLHEAHSAGAITAENVVEMWLLFRAMSTLRKNFHPQAWNGSQDDIEELHTKMIQVQNDLILERKKMFDEDEYEEEETDE